MVMTRKFVSGVRRAVCVGLAAGLALLAHAETASAQEILLTGPLAGAPAVRKQKLYREHRFEISPAASFSLLDEYQRQIFIGARINYNITDWLALGAWGASGFIKINTALSENIETVNGRRLEVDAANGRQSIDTKLTARNVGRDFTNQLGTIDWIFAPQLTLVPFRGKIALFQSIFADTDLYFFGGPAIIGVSERKDCGPAIGGCGPSSFVKTSSTRFAPTFGLGFSFYTSKMTSFGFEWRGMPFSRNTGGIDNHGGGPNAKFPDYSVNEKDREFKFNQMLTVSFGILLPGSFNVSE